MANSFGGQGVGTNYRGTNAQQPPNMTFNSRNPTTTDTHNVSLGDFWMNTDTEQLWVLISLAGTSSSFGLVATWVELTGSSGTIVQIDADSGNAVPVAGIINLNGDGVNITTTASGNSVVTSLNNNVTITGNFVAGGNISAISGSIVGGSISSLSSITALTTITATGNISTIAQVHGGTVTASTSMTALTSVNAGTTVNATTGMSVSGFTAGAIVSNNSGVFSSTNGTAGFVLTSTGATTAPTFQNFGGGLSSVQITLTNTQIKNIHASPITLVAAQGAGTTIWVDSVIAKLDYGGSNAFVNGSGNPLALFYTNNAGVSICGTILQNSQIIATSSQTYSATGTAGPMVAVASSTIENLSVVASSLGATEISGNTANDNTITINILYRVVTL